MGPSAGPGAMSSQMVIEECETEFRELTDRVEDDIRSLRNDTGNRNMVMKQVEHDLDEAENQLRTMEMEASGDSQLRLAIAPRLKECRAVLLRLRNDLSRAREAGDSTRLFSSYQNEEEFDPEGGQQMDRLLQA